MTITPLTKTKGKLSDPRFCRKYWTEHAHSLLVGAKIIKVQYMSNKECKELDWYSAPVAMLVKKDKKQFWILPQKDDEGNDGGALVVGEDLLPVLYRD